MALLQEDYKRSGIMPPALANQPKVDSHLFPYIDAYNTLRCHRTRTEVGYNPIDFQSLVAYAKLYGYAEPLEEFEKFCVLVQSCDHEFLTFSDEQRTRQIKAMTKK